MFDESQPLIRHAAPAFQTRAFAPDANVVKTISPNLISGVVLSKSLSDAIDRYHEPISKFVQADNISLGGSNALHLLSADPASQKPLFLETSPKLTPEHARRMLRRLGFNVCRLVPIRWPIGYAGDDGHRFRVVYNVNYATDKPGLQVTFTDPTTTKTKVNVVNILSRHLELMDQPATSLLTITADKPISTEQFKAALLHDNWEKAYFFSHYFHPRVKPLTYFDLPTEKTFRKLEMQFSRDATKSDERHYERRVSAMLKTIANP